MKIGILTLPLKSNYGGILQAYALQFFLRKLGHDAFQIKFYYWPLISWGIECYYLLARTLRKFLFFDKNVTHLRVDKKEVIKIKQKKELTDYFINKYINYIKLPKFFRKVWYKKYKFDAFIVGSDQVWRPQYAAGDLERYFLNFVKNNKVKKISYAASFGTDKWTFNQKKTDKFGYLLKRFNAVTVREESGITMCNEVFHITATQIMDPTILLAKEEYILLTENENEPQAKCGLFVYILDNNDIFVNFVNVIAAKLKITKVTTIQPENPDVYSTNPSVTNWLNGFHSAEFVLTDSFHGCIFSIIFNKPFVVLGNKERGLTRFYSLLYQFGLEDRLILSTDDFKIDLLNVQIDWSIINTLLARYRKEAENFLKFHLNYM